MEADQGFWRLDRDEAVRLNPSCSEEPKAVESGNRSGAPWESRKANWAHLVVRSGRPTGCAIGEARDAPKPNERGYRIGNRDGGVGSSERSARGANGGRRLRPQASRRSLGPLHFGKAALPILRS